MRLLILAESLAVVALAVAILLHGSAGAVAPPSGDVFAAARFLGDANPGERATYRSTDGDTIEFRVGTVDRGGPTGVPWMEVTRELRDAMGAPIPDDAPEYRHVLHKHGLFPFLTPRDPNAVDRLWVIRRIRRAELEWRKTTIRCWRVECIDPALPPDQDAVEVWMHEDVPVYGILRWQRLGKTWDCTSWKPRS